MRYRLLLPAPAPKSAPTGRRHPSTTRLQSQPERPWDWKTSDNCDLRVISVALGSDGCAHAGADIRGSVRF